MSVRFQPNAPRISYKPVEPNKPIRQLIGLYNQWQALAPETRAWLANLFRTTGEGQPTEEQTEAAAENMELMNEGLDPNLFNIANATGTSLIEDPDQVMLQNRDAAMTWKNLIDADEGRQNAFNIAMSTWGL